MTTGDSRSARGAAHLGATAIGVFWALVLVASLVQPEYSNARDYVSALASAGAAVPLLGITALLAFGLAYLATAAVLCHRGRSRPAALLVAGAGVLTWLVAIARIDCPDGAAYCGTDGGPDAGMLRAVTDPGWGPTVHGWAVAASYTCVAIAMATLALVAWRRRERRRLVVSAVALVASLATVPFWAIANEGPGLAQRVWLGILSVWVVLTCLEPRAVGHEQEVST